MSKRKRLTQADFLKAVAETSNEEEVKACFCEAFDYKLDSRYRMDLYTEKMLFEFKYDKPFDKVKARAKVVAQTMYYIRRLKYGQNILRIPQFICYICKHSAFLVTTKDFRQIYTSDKYDWDRAPSCPDDNMVEAISNYKALGKVHVYSFNQPLEYEAFCVKAKPAVQSELFADGEYEKKAITTDNFEQVFNLWQDKFRAYVQNGHRLADYFMADINPITSVPRNELSQVLFKLSDGTYQEKPMPMDDYKNFWDLFEKCDDSRILASLWQRLDRLRAEDKRRFNGEFYTPLEFASKAIEYLNRTVGENWWDNGYRLWDMAAGTGNLEYNLPTEALPYTYISTIEQDDADYCKKLFPSAGAVFQYDYLNDDVERFFGYEQEMVKNLPYKMPKNLYEDLHNPEIKWIIFINPPFVTANSLGTNKKSKDSVSMTTVRNYMTEQGLGETSRELFSQFLWRIHNEFKDHDAVLGMFSTLKYINANNDQKLRDNIFQYAFERGFCFPANVFSGNKNSWPVGFLVWNLAASLSLSLSQQIIVLDVFNEQAEKIGSKRVVSYDRLTLLNQWNRNPKVKNTEIMPPFSSAITPVPPEGHKDMRDVVAKYFLVSLMCCGSDVQHINQTAIFSAPQVSAGAYSVTPERFEKAMATFAVRRAIKGTWLNNRDQYLAPSVDPLPEEFIGDCTVYAMFHQTNQTASIKDVEYNGKTYQIINEFYPFLLNEVKSWPCSFTKIQQSLYAANTDRFGAKWLSEHKLSAEAQNVLEVGKEIYKLFYEKSSSLPWPIYKISMWDCGWYQIRMALQEKELGTELFEKLKTAYNVLEEKIRPLVFKYGFLETSEEMFEEV